MKRFRKSFAVLIITAIFVCSFSFPSSATGSFNYSSIGNIPYGNKYVTVSADPGTTATAIVDGAAYSSVYLNSYGSYNLPIPALAVGTQVGVTYSKDGASYTVYANVFKNEDYIDWFDNITVNSKKIKIDLYSVHYGDRIVVKIGKKKYSQTVYYDASNTSVTLKLKKKKGIKPGKQFTVYVYNQFGQLLDYNTDILYKTKKIRKGLTKKQARLVAGWRYPDEKYYSSGREEWCYDDDGDGSYDSFLYFRHGKVVNWYY